METARALVKSQNYAVDTTQKEICTCFLFFFVRSGELGQQPAIIELPVSCSFVFSRFSYYVCLVVIFYLLFSTSLF